jgi:hypothetical protein
MSTTSPSSDAFGSNTVRSRFRRPRIVTAPRIGSSANPKTRAGLHILARRKSPYAGGYDTFPRFVTTTSAENADDAKVAAGPISDIVSIASRSRLRLLFTKDESWTRAISGMTDVATDHRPASGSIYC